MTAAAQNDRQDAGAPLWPAPGDWLLKGPEPPPGANDAPLLLLAFHLECAGCISRAVPFLKRDVARYAPPLRIVLLHTAYGHRVRPRDEVAPTLTRFARDYARLPWPLAIDDDGALAGRLGAQGTPHWFVYGSDGRLLRSVYGSQQNALTRLRYLLEEQVPGGAAPASDR